MKVTLISYTPEAANLLIFTKGTRLKMQAAGMDAIRALTEADRLKELEYMANTIPSSWEFVDYVFMIEGVSRAYTHQQVRTRAGSYAQQTMRMINMANFEFVMPEALDEVQRRSIEFTLDEIRFGYERLIDLGVAPEDARSILPTNIATNIVCKFNLRTLAELARSRTGGRTQGEYIGVINAMLDAVIAVHPWASLFLFPKGRNLFDELEAFAATLAGAEARPQLLKLIDKLRKAM